MITGKVVDLADNSAIWNASVFISDAQGKITATAQGTTTDFDGNYKFTPTIQGGFLTASCTGYTKKTVPFNALSGTMNFALQSGVDLPVVEIIDTRITWWDKNKYYAIAGLTLAGVLGAILYNKNNKNRK
jgi:hypothetical protein